jgi:uncharacterized membrane protein
MKFTRSLLISAAFILIGLIVAVWLWPRLPAQVPSHWNVHGQIDGHMPRFWAAAFPPLMVLALAFLTWLLPAISPNRFRIGPFAQVFTGLMLVIQGFILVVGMCVLLVGAGYALPMPKISMLGVGALMVILGNYMGKLQRNFFIGIRTPWTIASEATWERTHRLAGKLFVLAGLVVLVGTIFGLPFWVGIACILAAALIPAAHSYVIYRRVEGPPQDEQS